MEKDKELYKEFLNGKNEALNELIKMYRTELIYFIHKYINDFQAAEDVSQEVFVYLLQHREIYDFNYSFRTYLYTIAKSRAYNYIKSRKRTVFIEENGDNIFSEISDVEEETFRNDESARVRKAIKKLKKEYQIVIYLIDLNGLSYEEAGVVMNKSIPQIKALIHNARKRLKVLLEEERKEEVMHDEINGRIY